MMYSRNYGRGDISAKITPPPAYSGSAIQGKETGGAGERREETKTHSSFAPYSQSIPFPKAAEEEKAEYEAACENAPLPPPPPREEKCEAPKCEAPKKKKNSLLSGLFSDLCTEDLILIGIVIALAFDLADRDILLVALVIAVVLM